MFSTVNTGKLLLAATIMACMMSAAQAYTAEQEQLCTSDAMRLCSSEIPDVDRITACMVRQRAQLSPACKSVFTAAPSDTRATPVKASRPMNLVPAKSSRGGI